MLNALHPRLQMQPALCPVLVVSCLLQYCFLFERICFPFTENACLLSFFRVSLASENFALVFKGDGDINQRQTNATQACHTTIQYICEWQVASSCAYLVSFVLNVLSQTKKREIMEAAKDAASYENNKAALASIKSAFLLLHATPSDDDPFFKLCSQPNKANALAISNHLYATNTEYSKRTHSISILNTVLRHRILIFH